MQAPSTMIKPTSCYATYAAMLQASKRSRSITVRTPYSFAVESLTHDRSTFAVHRTGNSWHCIVETGGKVYHVHCPASTIHPSGYKPTNIETFYLSMEANESRRTLYCRYAVKCPERVRIRVTNSQSMHFVRIFHACILYSHTASSSDQFYRSFKGDVSPHEAMRERKGMPCHHGRSSLSSSRNHDSITLHTSPWAK